MVGTLVMAPKSVTFRRHDHLVSVLFGDLLSHSYNITFSMFLDLVRNIDSAMMKCAASKYNLSCGAYYSIHSLDRSPLRRLNKE